MIIKRVIEEEDGITNTINNLSQNIQIRIQIQKNKTVSQMNIILENLEKENSTNSERTTITMNRNHMSGTVNSCNGKKNSTENLIRTAKDMTKTANLVRKNQSHMNQNRTNQSHINQNHINWSHINQSPEKRIVNP